MRAIILLIALPVMVFARGGEISQPHLLYLRYLHDAYSIEIPAVGDTENIRTEVSIARVEPSDQSGRLISQGGLVIDGETGQMVESGIPRTSELAYTGEILIMDRLSGSSMSSRAKVNYNWRVSLGETAEASEEIAKDRAYNVWSQGGYVIMTHTSELNERSDVTSHLVIPSTWVDWLRSGLEAQQELVNADTGKLVDAAKSENPVIAKYALRELAESGKLELATFTQSISDRNDFDEVVLVNTVISAIDESSSGSEELQSAILRLASEQSSFEKAVLYSMSRYINFPDRSPRLRMYTPSGDLLETFSAAAEKRLVGHFSDKKFSDFASAVSVYLFGSEERDSKPESLSVTQSVQAPVAEKPKSEEPAEVTPVIEPSEEPTEQASQWWLWLVGALVVVGSLGLVHRRKS